ncbi:uncharacterized protein [Rutidosis leptorrhynchoides]|uniref:uncharacterized protein isoform X2 n=1 Tax=Rutidosis leptorrhynchoides TaxID=125765 RepID=UPI003A98D3B5
MEKGDYSKLAKEWLENSSRFQLDGMAQKGMKIDRVELGYVRCYFVIPDHLLDQDVEGNWNAGAISVLMDGMAAGAVFSICGGHLATIDFTMSFYSTVKVNDPEFSSSIRH